MPSVLPMTWGIQGIGGLIISARKKMIWDKPTFRHLIQNRRYTLPSPCFYEWGNSKHKATLYGKKNDVLFLAGVYESDAGGGQFVIITEPATRL